MVARGSAPGERTKKKQLTDGQSGLRMDGWMKLQYDKFGGLGEMMRI